MYNNLGPLFTESKDMLGFIEPHHPEMSMPVHVLLYRAQLHEWFSKQKLDLAVPSITGEDMTEVFQLLRAGQQKHYGDQACLEFFETVFLDGLRVLCDSYTERDIAKEVGPAVAAELQDVLCFLNRFPDRK